MALDGLMNRLEAADTLQVDPRTVLRYVDEGLLTRVKVGSMFMYKEEDLSLMVCRINARHELDSVIKELYVLSKSGFTNKQIAKEFGVSAHAKIAYALEMYRNERTRYFNKFGIESIECEDILLVEEVAARLRITDNHVVYDLIRAGRLKARELVFGRQGKVRYFVEFDSFRRYLGDYFSKFLYRSHHVAEQAQKTINQIDLIALDEGIGFKIKESKQGNYLFSPGEIVFIRKH